MTAGRTTDRDPAANGPAVSAIRVWVALYTKGLPAGTASDRRALIENDLWEEAQTAIWMGETDGLTRQRISRWLRGLPADVAWRLEHQSGTMKLPWRADMRISKGQAVVIGITTIYYVLILVGLLASASFREENGMAGGSLGLILSVAGLLLAVPRPRAGFVVGMIGTGLIFLVTGWIHPFALPLPIVLGYRLAKESTAATPSVTHT